MIVYVDTSALYALLVSDDMMHDRARSGFQRLAQDNARLVTTSYVLVETTALLQRRVGLQAVVDFQMRLEPLLDVIWVDAQWHAKGGQRLLAHGSRDVSLVDCLGFEVMEAKGIKIAFAFDRHFSEQGFAEV